jgi:FkbM family methyltransferase
MPPDDAQLMKDRIRLAGDQPSRHAWLVRPIRRILWPLVRPYLFSAVDQLARNPDLASSHPVTMSGAGQAAPAPATQSADPSAIAGAPPPVQPAPAAAAAQRPEVQPAAGAAPQGEPMPDRVAPAGDGRWGGHASFSQCGEDRIVAFIAQVIGLGPELRIADVGAAHPVQDNNSYLSYLAGGTGLLVEADPAYRPLYAALRPRDTAIQAAVVPRRLMGNGTITFHAMEDRGWSSISADHAALAERLGKGGVRQSFEVPCATLDGLLLQHFPDRHLDLLSLDVEGVDRELLEEFDFGALRPKIIVVENDGGEAVHAPRMRDVGYRVYGSTFVNTIYVDAAVMAAARF